MTAASRINRRFIPLYVAAFFQGFIFWYTVEKLFVSSLGFSDADIGWMVAIYSAVMLLVETPSGILADRWSRRGVLILGSIFLLIATIIGGFSTDFATYIWSAIFWGAFFAMYSGTYESVVYDSLLEESGNAKEYEKYYGRIAVVDSVALVISSLAGGVVAELFGLRAVYYASIPLILISILALLRFKEPKLHKVSTDAGLKEHVKQTFGAVAKQHKLRPVLAVLLLNGTVSYILFELSQLWLIALAVPIVAFGIANAMLLSTLGAGGVIAVWLKLYEYKILLVAIGLMAVACIALVFSRNLVVVVGAQMVLGAGATAVDIVFMRFLNDELPSRLRAGASSAVSSINHVLLIPAVLLFSYVSDAFTIFKASWVFLALVLLAGYFVLRTLALNRRLAGVEASDATHVQRYNK